MLLDLRLKTAPAVDAVTLAEAKQHAGIFDSDADADLQAKLDGAIAHLDGYAGVLGRALVTQSWTLSLERFPPPCARPRGHARRLTLPLPPLISVESIAYVDPAGATQTLAADQYVVLAGPLAAIDPAPGVAWPATRCQGRAVTVEFTCGYGATAATVPAPLRSAIKLIFADLYANREAQVIGASGFQMRNDAVEQLLRGFKVSRL